MPVQPEIVATPYSVLPTPTDVVEIVWTNVRSGRLTITNNDGSQVVQGTLMRRTWPTSQLVPEIDQRFMDLQPGESRSYELEARASYSLVPRLTASGLGCQVTVEFRPDGGRR